MIKTGLPYRLEEINMISTDGAIVNMHDIRFPVVEEKRQIETALIFLRNTGFKNVSLNFDKCDYVTKKDYLKAYLTTDVVVSNEELSDAVMAVLDMWVLNETSPIDTFMSKKDCEKFIKEEGRLLDSLAQLLVSIPIYSMSRLKANCEMFTMDDIVKTDDNTFGANFMNLLQYPEMQTIIPFINKEPLFYTKFFTEDNNDLFDKIAESKLGIAEILYGFETVKAEDFALVIKEMDDLIECVVSKK